ncbi:hypothetical protein VNO80_24916 [Phaseolus coccineus]|uniref:Uncharacterized protein n=1 Tax=Phaseolus coccineus TaxID=3886 RepID=A0AAN9QLH0_PHACN
MNELQRSAKEIETFDSVFRLPIPDSNSPSALFAHTISPQLCFALVTGIVLRRLNFNQSKSTETKPLLSILYSHRSSLTRFANPTFYRR